MHSDSKNSPGATPRQAVGDSPVVAVQDGIPRYASQNLDITFDTAATRRANVSLEADRKDPNHPKEFAVVDYDYGGKHHRVVADKYLTDKQGKELVDDHGHKVDNPVYKFAEYVAEKQRHQPEPTERTKGHFEYYGTKTPTQRDWNVDYGISRIDTREIEQHHEGPGKAKWFGKEVDTTPRENVYHGR